MILFATSDKTELLNFSLPYILRSNEFNLQTGKEKTNMLKGDLKPRVGKRQKK